MARIPTTEVFNPSNLAPELRDYYLQHRDLIFNNFYFDEDFKRLFTVLHDVRGKTPLTGVDIDIKLQAQTDYRAWAPQTDVVNLSNRFLEPQEIKIDLEIVPQHMQQTFMAAKMNAHADHRDLSFFQWFVPYINNKMKEEILLEAVFRGEREGGAGDSRDAMDGALNMIADEITATNITPVVTGVLSYANTRDAIKAVVRQADAIPGWAKKRKQVLVSDTVFEWYREKLEELRPHLLSAYGKNIEHVMELPLDGSNAMVKRCFGLGDSSRIICTIKENMILGFDSDWDMANMDFQVDKRVINVIGDFKACFNFAYLFDGSIAVNDQA